MTHIHYTVSLHNLPVSADINRKVALIARCPDDGKSLNGPGDSIEQLSEPDHHWKIVVTRMFLELAKHMKAERNQIETVRWMTQITHLSVQHLRTVGTISQ